MSGGEVGLLMISLFIITVLLGFPIVFTLMGMAVFFGYYAYATPDQVPSRLRQPDIRSARSEYVQHPQ